MDSLNIVVPIKDPARSKERLSHLLSSDKRGKLSVALFEGVLEALETRPPSSHLLVVTESKFWWDRLEAHGISVLRLERALGETDAVLRATEWSMQHQFASQLVIPGDMGALVLSDLKTLWGTPRPNPSLILCPATGDNGTNAVLSTPPDAVPYRFGRGSFHDFRKEAHQREVPCRVLRLESFVLDIDTEDDLRCLSQMGGSRRIEQLLEGWKIDGGS